MCRRQAVSFTIVSGSQDKFERKSYEIAKQELECTPDVHFESLPGGHCLALELPRRVAALIDGLAMAPAFDEELAWGKDSVERGLSSDAGSLSTEHSSISALGGWGDTEIPDDNDFPL